ncbi:hypothetical protein MMC25_006297 [Agyrium rufum]|nr:hypothetical protein [Agyrium rufum]
MSLVNLSHVCSHIQNASKARLGLTSIPPSNLHLSLAHQLLRQGLISSVSLGGRTPPPPSPLLGTPSLPTSTETNESLITQENVASRRLWLGLKYWNNEPVLGNMKMVSKPTRRIWMPREDLEALARGEERKGIKGLRQIGECLFVTTDRGVMEIRECVERRVGGMLLCRAW